MNSKAIQRIGFISGNALRQILVSIFNVAVPFLVLHFSNKEIWGAFVSFLLFTLLVSQVVNWGNKEYQLRQFSQSPSSIAKNYSGSLSTRWILVLAFSITAFIWFPVWQSLFIILWIFGRYLAQSTEALVIYEKTFNASIIIETISFMFFCSGFLWLKSQLDLQLLLILYSSYQIIKGIWYFVLFQKFFSFSDFNTEWNYYRRAFPFFLLSVLGFLASKVDVYLIALMKDRIATADYQIINSLLVFVMSISAFVYAPFTKNIYRNTEIVIDKTRNILLVAGLAMVPASLIVVAIILNFYLNLQFPLWFYFVAFAYVFPAFAYGIDVVGFFRLQKEKIVVLYLFIGAFANTVLSAGFIYFDYGIPGALTGSAVAQIIVLTLFKLNRR